MSREGKGSTLVEMVFLVAAVYFSTAVSSGIVSVALFPTTVETVNDTVSRPP